MMRGGKVIDISPKPGPELDQQVMARIMGGMTEEAIPSFSVYIGHAFDIVERLSERWGFSLVCVGKKCVATFSERLVDKPKQVQAGASTAALAICIAALKARSIESGIVSQ